MKLTNNQFFGMIFILFVIPFLLAPLLYLSWGFFNLGVAMSEMSPGDMNETAQAEIASGDSPAILRARFERLKSLAAYRGESVQHPPYLNIAFLDYEQSDEQSDETEPADNARGYRKISVDLEFLKKSAVVFISEMPIIYEFKNGNFKQRARIGFEGVGAIDVRDAHQGLISGLRVEAFGADDVARSGDIDAVYYYDDRSRPQAKILIGHRRACKSIRAWASVYGAKWEDIQLWKLTNPEEITLFQHKIASQSFVHDELTYLLEKCRRIN